jgi:hypothetical protein
MGFEDYSRLGYDAALLGNFMTFQSILHPPPVGY